MNVCPCCRRPWPDRPDPEADPIAALRQFCQDRGLWIGPSDIVDERTAAQILGRSEHTLRGWRAGSRPLAFKKSGSRIRYSLRDIALFESNGKNPE